MKAKNNLGRWQATALAVSFVVGTGILVLPTLALDLAGPQASLVAWIATTVLAIPLIAMFVILGKRHYRPGGITEYAVEALGDRLGIGVHLSMTTALLLGMPAMIHVTAIYVAQVLGVLDIWLPVISHSILLLLCLNHLRPVRQSTRISLITTVFLFIVAGCAIASNPEAIVVGVSSLFEKWTFSVGSFQNAAILVFFGFVGWESMSLCVRELRDPTKDAGFVYWVSFVTVTFVYLSLASTVSGFALMNHKIRGTDGILRLLSQSSFLAPLQISIIAVLIANLNAWVLAGYRQFQLFEGALRPIHSKINNASSEGKTGRARRRFLLAYFLLVSLLLLGLDFKQITPAWYFKLSSQNWIVMYVGILLFFFKKVRAHGERIVLVLAALSFLVLISSLSWTVLFTGICFVIGAIWKKIQSINSTDKLRLGPITASNHP